MTCIRFLKCILYPIEETIYRVIIEKDIRFLKKMLWKFKTAKNKSQLKKDIDSIIDKGLYVIIILDSTIPYLPT